jgi:hypothetical protein
MGAMRAILIDAENEAVKEIDVEPPREEMAEAIGWDEALPLQIEDHDLWMDEPRNDSSWNYGFEVDGVRRHGNCVRRRPGRWTKPAIALPSEERGEQLIASAYSRRRGLARHSIVDQPERLRAAVTCSVIIVELCYRKT